MGREQFGKDALSFFEERGVEEAYCVFCGKSQSSFILFQKSKALTISRCKKCGFVYNKTQPDSNALREFYSSSSPMKSWADLKDNPAELEKQKEKFMPAILKLKNLNIKKVLDVGCGNGYFLHLLKEEMPKIEMFGTELNKDAEKVACLKHGITINPHYSEMNNFDLISFWGVIEHVKDPIRTLQEASQWLSPGGYILVCVPNVNSEAARILWKDAFMYCPQHLWYFDRNTLEAVVEKAGLTQVDSFTVEPEARPILRRSLLFSPYLNDPEVDDFVSRYFDQQAFEKTEELIKHLDVGYKIVSLSMKA